MIELATEAGFTAGIVIGALLLVANSWGRRVPPARYAQLFGLLLFPAACAVVAGLSFGLICARWDPLHLAAEADFLESAAAQNRFALVWAFTGAYTSARWSDCCWHFGA